PPELQLRFKENIGVLPWQHVVVFEKVGPDGGFPKPVNTQPETTPKTTPDQALENVRLPEGFRASVFASEPDVRQPIAICTDERGRLWVAENYSYAESAVNFDRAQRDRIVILEDTDGDGVHDSRRVFWDEGRLLTSVEVGFGGVFVLCAPQLLFIPDLDRDDIPDGPHVTLLDGFDDGPVRHNIVNGLKWGPDGWLYGRHGILATSQVGPPGATPSQRTRLNCGVWRYEPISRRFEVVAHGTTNPWGHDWTAEGECFFVNTVNGHLWHVIPGAHFAQQNGIDPNPFTYELIDQHADH
ncbi:MAG: PVC-type heme-binding CxxCH protein, partial [Planctomycetaceae bacterium]